MSSQRHEKFRALFEQHRGILFKVAHTYASNAEDRADLAQEIAAQLWRGFARYDESRPFSTWMYRVALNVGISSLRSRPEAGRTDSLDALHEQIASPDAASIEESERIRDLQRAIARLDAMNRALALLHLDERSHREIAEILGISESNVGTKLDRLRRRLRGELSQGETK